jgi:hypothetical protein
MITQNDDKVAPVQRDFNSSTDIKHDSTSSTDTSHDPSCLLSATMHHTPSPLTVHHTPPPTRLFSTSPSPVAETQTPDQDVLNNTDDFPSETADIFDYMVWAQLNLILGGIVLGIPGFLIALQTRKYKRDNNVRDAKIFSKIGLVFNIIVSFLFMCSMIYVINHYTAFY